MTEEYTVVVNEEEQYSIWPAGGAAMPTGWRATGFTGGRAACLEHIAQVWSDPRPAGVRGVSIPDLVEEQVARTPDLDAVTDPATGETLSYARLWSQAGRLAAELIGHGVRHRDIVAVRFGRSVDLIVAMLGVARAGAAYLCVDADAPKDRVALILEQADAAAILHAPHSTVGVPVTRGMRLEPRRGAAPIAPPAPIAGDDPIYVMFTSGSTGVPKGVVVPHRAVRRLAVAPLFCHIEAGDRVANAANPAFDATTFEVWNALVAGGTVVVFPALTDVTFSQWSKLLVSAGITTMFLTTSLFHLIARERPAVLGSLKTLVVGGEQLDLGAVRRTLDAGGPGRLVNGYGPTETTTFAAYFDCDEASLAGLSQVPIGYPLQDTTLHILDEQLEPVPAGVTGELCVGGPGVALGYLGLAELTAQRFVVHPGTGQTIYRTGDLARELPGGAIELLGRLDRQIKLWGFRIELGEIEAAAVATKLVDYAFVEKTGDGPDAVLVGFVLPKRGVETEGLGRILSRELAGNLPSYMIPARWIVLSDLPLGPTGKVDRQNLLQLLAHSDF